MTKPVTIAIAAGGTGGHIFPGIAVGSAINRIAPDARVIYLCGDRPLESEIYRQQGIEPIVLPARQVRGGLTGKLGGVLAAAGNTFRAWQILRREGVTAVAGFGGYTSGPTVLAGKLAGAKTIIHEANSIPGKSNRILAKLCDITTAYFPKALETMGGRQKIAVGMPLRQMDFGLDAGAARERLGLNSQMPMILVTGGSQGAKRLYEVFLETLPVLDQQLESPVQVLWSTGAGNFDWIAGAVTQGSYQNLQVHVKPFISEMNVAMAAADLAVARAGASTIAELVTFGVFGLYVPLPTAIYDHQTLNAREVEKAGFGTVINEGSLDPDKLAHQIITRLSLRDNGSKLPLPVHLDSRDAAERLARLILG